MEKIRVNPGPSKSVVARCLASSALPDMRSVTSTVLRFRVPSGVTTKDLATTVVSSSETELVVKHVFALGEINVIGTWARWPIHTTAAGPIEGQPVQFEMVNEWEQT